MYNTPLPGLLSIYRVKMSSVQIPVKYGAAGSPQSSPHPHTHTHTHTTVAHSLLFDRLLFVSRASAASRTGRIKLSFSLSLCLSFRKKKKEEKKDNEDAATSCRRSYSFAEGLPQNSKIYQGYFVIHSIMRRSFVILGYLSVSSTSLWLLVESSRPRIEDTKFRVCANISVNYFRLV